MAANARHGKILEQVAKQVEVTVNDLAERLGVSRETIRRDLTELEARQLLNKTHGGARQIESVFVAADQEGTFQSRMKMAASAKARIAEAAIKLLKRGDSLFVDTGSTTVAFAKALARVEGLTVITNSAMIAALATNGGKNEVIALGGNYRAAGAEMVGSVTCEQIAHYGAKFAFLTVAAVTESGVFDFDREEAEVARAMVKHSKQLVVLADSDKYAKTATYNVANLAQISTMVTDKLPRDDLRRLLGKEKIAIIKAD